jgi:transmembrane sensor
MESQAIEDTAARWVARRYDDAWTDADQARLEEWLQAATAHRISYLRLETAWSHAARLQALGGGTPAGVIPPRRSWSTTGGAQDVSAEEQNATAVRARSGLWLSAAAVLVMAIAGSLLYLAVDRSRGDRYSTAVGGLETVSLGDGSQVILNTDTRIRVSLRESERRVDLERGEAFFVVAKDRSRPFVVRVGNKSVIAVGTRFSVRRESNDVQVVVTEGRVSLAPSGGDPSHAPTSLDAGAIARTLNAEVLVSEQSAPEAEQLLTWRSGFVSFHDTPLAEAVTEFNRYNIHKIVIADASIAGIRIGGNFRSNNADAFLWLLQRGFPIAVERDEERTLLKRR